MTDFALYHGEELILIGSAEECAEAQGCSVSSLKFWATPTGRRKSLGFKDQSKALHVIRLDAEEADES